MSWCIASIPYKPSYIVDGIRRVVYLDGGGSLVFASKVKPGARVVVQASFHV